MSVEGWDIGTLGELCGIAIGGTPSRNNPIYWDAEKATDNLWVSTRDLNQMIITETSEYLTEQGVKNSNVKKIKKGTILLSFKLTIGRVAFAGKDLYTNEAIAGLETNKIASDFLYYGLQQWDLLQGVDQAIKGATLNKQKLNKIQFYYPVSTKEQEQIADILSTIDRAIAQTEAIIAKQQRIKTGLMQDLLTKGIDKHGNIRSEATHEFKDSAIGRIPVEWEVSTLENQCIKVTDGTHQQVKTTEAGIPFLYVSCVREGMILWNRSAMIDLQTYKIISQGREPKNGVILYTVVGSYGYAALVESDAIFSFQRHIAYILPNQEKLDSKFLMEWMNSKKIRDYTDKSALGNAQKTITLGELRQFPLFIPNKDEQTKIVQCLSKQNTIINQYCIVLDKLKTKKTGLMQDLLTGKVRVTELLKEKEPASP